LKAINRKQEQAIAALLSAQTIKAAAAECGVAEVTLWRWLQSDEFAAAYRTARRQVVEKAITEIQGAASKAVATLIRNLDSTDGSVEVRAANSILDRAVRGVEIIELTERIEKLETRIEETEGRAKRWA
jgi:hypothetical protein